MSKIYTGLIPLTSSQVSNLKEDTALIFFPPISKFEDSFGELNPEGIYFFEKAYNEGKSLKLKGFGFIYPSEFFALAS